MNYTQAYKHLRNLGVAEGEARGMLDAAEYTSSTTPDGIVVTYSNTAGFVITSPPMPPAEIPPLPPLSPVRLHPKQRADSVNAHAIAGIGVELMNAFNHGKTDPSDMAVNGHDTATGFEFFIERNGVVYAVSVARDWSA